MGKFKEFFNEQQARVGVHINDKVVPWTDWILDGTKTIETRNTNSLKSLIGHRVGIIRTGVKGGAALVGYVTIGEPLIYRTIEDFNEDIEKHRVDTNYKGFEFRDMKFGYPMLKPERIEPVYGIPFKGNMVTRPLM
jgi:hypothetical protein